MRSLRHSLWKLFIGVQSKSPPSYLFFTLFVIEIIINGIIVLKIPYTEIDWIAYMQEVEGVLKNGTYDYSLLRGDTGPLVYPAGFVWIYSVFYFITNEGKDIVMAQFLFIGVYLVSFWLVCMIYKRVETVPFYLFSVMTFTSYRLHSIYALRLFNDPIAHLLLLAAVYCFISYRWSLGSLLFSFAVSVKMNILLYSPALLYLFILNLGFKRTLLQLFICAAPQVLLALPFLQTAPLSYILGAFDLRRVFFYQWTVNFRFVPERVFVSAPFHMLLLQFHVMALFMTWRRVWHPMYQTLGNWGASSGIPRLSPVQHARFVCVAMFSSNFVGICFARSLHYQFYVWYYHSLLFLLCSVDFGLNLPQLFTNAIRLSWLLCVEYCWNMYPSTICSSILLNVCHLTLLASLFITDHYTKFLSKEYKSSDFSVDQKSD